MSTTIAPQTVELTKVLDWVNTQRKELGMDPLEELPKGMCHIPSQCVIANALYSPGLMRYISVGPYDAYAGMIDGSDWELRFPAPITQFVWAFDRGEYPELIDEAA